VSAYRVVFITRHFWPHWNGASRTIGNVAAALVERGWQATVLTVLKQSERPTRFAWRGVSVTRFPYDQQSRRGEIRWLRSLARWLRAHRSHYDLVCVSMLRRDAYAALGAVGRSVPVVLRAEAAGRWGDCLWQLDAKCGRRIKQRCMKAAALVGPSRSAYRELIAAGYPRERIHYIPHGAAKQPIRTELTRKVARDSLAESHSSLILPEGAPLAVYVGWLHLGRGLITLVNAWERIVARWPSARLWLVGGGPHQASLQEHIDARGLGGRAALVGQFDEVHTLLAAADLFVLPAPEKDFSVALLEAMAAGLPAAACDNSGNRELLEDEHQGLLVPPGDTDAMATALARLIDQSQWARRLGDSARDRTGQDFSLAKMVEAHVTLFEDLLARPC